MICGSNTPGSNDGPDWEYRTFRLNDSIGTRPTGFMMADVTPTP